MVRSCVAAVLMLAMCAPALAGPWDYGYGDDYDYGAYGYEGCVVERKFKRNGDYKEKLRCPGGPAWVAVPAPPPVVVVPTWDGYEPVEPPPEPEQPVIRQCREYRTVATIDGRSERLYGTACRQPDGSWRFDP